MNDLGNLLQMIYDLLSGWFTSFTSHATAVMEKLNLIETDTASIKNSASDIKDNTDDIKDNTGAIVTPVQSIKTNTDSIKNDTTTIKNNVSTMTNQLGTISTNVGTASAFTEDVANNTLDIKDRIVTIGSDTTQLRSNSNTITSDVSDIKTALNYYLANTPVTEDVEGSICNCDTDLTDYLQACNVTIPADQTGFSGITLTKTGKNLTPYNEYNSLIPAPLWGTNFTSFQNFLNTLPSGTYTLRNKYKVVTLPGNNTVQYVAPYVRALINGSYVPLNTYSVLTDNNPAIDKVYDRTTVITITPEAVGKISNIYLYCDSSVHSGSDRGTYIAYDFELELGDTTSTIAYEPYKSMTYTITFGTTITDGAEINLLDGIIKVNSTPVSYLSISPIVVRTYKGINNIYSDIGTTALTYRETLKHYIDKQEA